MALRSVRFYRRTTLSVFLGAAIASAVLVGGLLVGDCVTYSLRRLALMRLGETRAAMQLHGRFFDADLAARFEREATAPTAAALVLNGVLLANRSDNEPTQVNHVQIVGVTSNFWRLSTGPAYPLDRNQAAVNPTLAKQAGITEGEAISLRVGRASLMPRDAPLASRGDALTRRGTFTVRHVVPDGHLGRFSLAANQVAPRTVFVDMEWLQEAAGIPGRANVMLVGASPEGDPPVDALNRMLKRVWRLNDVGISLRRHESIVQLQSDRIFLEPAVSEAAESAGLSTDCEAAGTLTYLVDSVRHGERVTPYSFAVAIEPSSDAAQRLVPPGMRDDDVIINQWLAEQIKASQGDTVTVAYHALTPDGFDACERTFTVRRVAAMEEFENERNLLPAFPGLTDVEQCREWDIGMPMDEAALQDAANEAYWDTYRATPKLVVSLAAGRQMWANRFGNTSAIRYPLAKTNEADLHHALIHAIDPASLGLALMPVRDHALKAVTEGLSLGEWFASMSCFLIASALILTAMLFAFGIQQRAEEMGILLGVGHRASHVRRQFLWEGSIVALVACTVGGVLGLGYTRLLIFGLAQYWQGAVPNAAIRYHAEPGTVFAGVGCSLVCALTAMGIAMRRQSQRPARALLAGDLTQEQKQGTSRPTERGPLVFVLGCVLAASGAVAFGLLSEGTHAVYVFFGAGFLLLMAGLGLSNMLLQHLNRKGGRRLSVSRMGTRNAARRPGRSLTVVALMALGGFIVFAVSAMQQDLAASANQRSSGTGGFALFGESTIPVPDALETQKGRAAFGLEREECLTNVQFVSLKVREGDDASCFNLNRAQAPRLLGVDVDALRSRGAFMPQGATDGIPWSLLDVSLPDGVVPGLAGDTTTVMWNLRKRVDPETGDEIVYRDERGEPFRVRLVGTLPVPLSILQGTVLIPKTAFVERYPSESGYRMFLVDLPNESDPAVVQQALTRRTDRIGLDVTSALSRLLAFHSVEATYLSMFLVLGGLGVILGTLGLGILVLRNMLERRSELAILRCIGFSRPRILWLVLVEHWLLLALGLGCGLISTMVAIWPSLASPGMHVPLRSIAALAGGIVLAGCASTTIAVLVALHGELIPALRNE